MRHTPAWRVPVAVLALLLTAPILAQKPSGAQRQAKRILAKTGVQGGLIAHVECGDGALTVALRADDGFIVQGLARDRSDVEAARARVAEAGLEGPVSIDRWDGNTLPYADNLVNLIVCADRDLVDMAEVMRVLVPNGVAYLRRDGKWTTETKPRPTDIDDWTHYLHGPDGNPVSNDTVVGPPRRLQWVGGPEWARHHDHMASMTSLVSTNGRLFYIIDEGSPQSIQMPADWHLVARDAFNGTVLWEQAISQWNTHQWPLKSGPAHLLRRLVAIGDTVYVTPSLTGPVEALDAATGRPIRTYKGSEDAGEIVVSDDTLLAATPLDPETLLQWRRRATYVWDNTTRANRDWAWTGGDGSIKAYDASSGKRLWESDGPVAPCSLAADNGRAVYHDGEKMVCLNMADGSVLWESEPVKISLPLPTSTGVRTLIHGDRVLVAGNTGVITGLSMADGSSVYEARHLPSGHQSLRDLMVVGGLVWTGHIAGGGDPGNFIGYDPETGEAKVEFLPDVERYWFHHRCYPSKATSRFILASRTGIEFIDPKAEHWETHHWVRGGCIYGVMPCNGMVYAPMNACGCYLESKLNGFNALAPGPVPEPDEESLSDAARLERGPAYGYQNDGDASLGDWPAFRHDAARSGATPTTASVGEDGGWRADIGGRLTAPVIADGRLYVAAIDEHTLHAIDADTGEPLWTYTAGGRIDSPPTIYRGLVLTGSADGYVSALRDSDGVLAWRYRAAPIDRRMVAYDQLESTWPVHGSVLVHDGVLYCTAGRSIFLDGGIRLLKLDPVTGRKLSETVMDETDPETGENMQIHVKGLNMPVALSDVLSCDGSYLYMRSQKIDFDGNRLEIPVEDVTKQPDEGAHLFCQIGFLDDSWFHRSYWTFGRRVTGGYGGWFLAGRNVPAGRIMTFDDDKVYGYGRKPEYMVNASVLEYHLFAAEKHVEPDAIDRVRRANREMNTRLDRNAPNSSDWKLRRYYPSEDLTAARFDWEVDQPSLQVRAMVVAGDTLFVAGNPDVIDEREAYRLPDDPDVQKRLVWQVEAIEGKHGGRLWAVSTDDGLPTARYALDVPPVFDGLVAAQGRLFMSALDGSVRRLAVGETGGIVSLAEGEPLNTVSDEPAEPDYLKPPEVDKSADFDQVIRCRVVESDIGYRLNANGTGIACLALDGLGTPLTGKATISLKLRVGENRGFLQNGFIVFGDSAEEADLVKCGIRYKLQQALVVQGPLLDGGTTETAEVDAPLNKQLDIVAEVDLAAQTVAFTTCGRTIEVELRRPMTEITHVGFCTDSALADFTPIEVNGVALQP